MNIATQEKNEAGVDPAKPVEQDLEPRLLTSADIEALREILGTGLGGFARQGDIVELHKRIGEKFERLPSELSVLEAASLEKMQTQLDEIETSLNGLEGALRIELAPFLGQIVKDAASATQPRATGRWTARLGVLAMLFAAVAAGAIYSDDILTYAAQARATLGF